MAIAKMIIGLLHFIQLRKSIFIMNKCKKNAKCALIRDIIKKIRMLMLYGNCKNSQRNLNKNCRWLRPNPNSFDF